MINNVTIDNNNKQAGVESYTTIIVGYVPENLDFELIYMGDESEGNIECGYRLYDDGSIANVVGTERHNPLYDVSEPETSSIFERYKAMSQYILKAFFIEFVDLNIGFSTEDLTLIELLRMNELYKLEEEIENVHDLITDLGSSTIRFNNTESEIFNGYFYVYITEFVDGEEACESYYKYNKVFPNK